jgi:hypothetical protein
VPNLYEIETELQALVDSAETVSPEMAEQYAVELQAALQNSIAKRQRVGEFLRHCEAHEDACDREIDRLKALKIQYSKARERVEDFVIRTVLTIGPDEKGKLKVLEGETVKLSVKGTPDAVLVENESAVPMEFQRVTVKMPHVAWQVILDALPDSILMGYAAEVKQETSVDKTAVRNAIKQGRDIPGAKLQGGFRLEVK